MEDYLYLQKKRAIILTIVCILLIVLVFSIQRLLYGPAKPIQLTSAPTLTGVVTQSLVSTGNGQTLPSYAVDFKLGNIVYFENKSWAVVPILALNNSINDSYVVVQLQNGVHTVVLGPGSSFPGSAAQSMPPDVANYLRQLGVLYESN